MRSFCKTFHFTKLLLTVVFVGLLGMSTGILPAAQAAESVSTSTKPIKVSAWNNGFGLLDDQGDVWYLGKRVPTKVKGLDHVIDISYGRNGLAVKEDGTVWIWGENGDQSTQTTWFYSMIKPLQIPELKNIVKVSSSNGLFAALDSDGTVWTWCFAVQQLDDLTKFDQKPIAIPGLHKVKDITIVHGKVIALQEDGTVWRSEGIDPLTVTWTGGNVEITKNSTYTITTKQIPGLTDIIELGKGTDTLHLLTLKKDGTVWAWGSNHYGQLIGQQGEAEPWNAIQVPGLSDIVALSSGWTHSLALKKDGTLWEWGYFTTNEIDSYKRLTTPVQVKGLDQVKAISSGISFNTVIQEDGTLWAWGGNDGGQLHDNTNVSKFSPIKFMFPSTR